MGTSEVVVEAGLIWAADFAFRPAGSSTIERPLLNTLDERAVEHHPDLEENFRDHLSPAWGYDATVFEGDEERETGHGMHATGIAAAHTDNGLGGGGTCPGCSILFSHFDIELGSQAEKDEAQVQNLFDLMASGVQVINMSFGEPYRVGLAPFRSALMEAADELDIVLVASAGNDRRGSADFPADLPQVIGVAGTDPQGNRWNDTGNCVQVDQCGSNFGSGVSIAAPAKSVLSAWLPNHDFSSGLCGDSLHDPAGDGFGFCTGTSMSAPFVTGTAGLIRSINPLLSRLEVQAAIESTGRDNGDPSLGAGLLDTRAAVEVALGVSGGELVKNRLTPLFSLWSPRSQGFLRDHDSAKRRRSDS